MYRSYDVGLTPHNFLCDVCSRPANDLMELKRSPLMFIGVAGRQAAGHSKFTMKLKEAKGRRHE